MIQKVAAIIEIPNILWNSYPEERSFFELVCDLEGAARRINKGVNVKLEETRYSQLCSHIESAAIDLVWAKSRDRADSVHTRLQLASVNILELKDQDTDDNASNFVRLASMAEFSTIVSPARISEFRNLMDMKQQLRSVETKKDKSTPSPKSFVLHPTVKEFLTGCVSRDSGLVISVQLRSVYASYD